MNERNALNFSWLLRLRYGAVVGQLAIIAAVGLVLGVELPIAALGVVIGIELLSNIGATLWARRHGARIGEAAIGGLMLLDILLLSALLYLTGGPFNPFSSLYLVNIALAAVVLGGVWSWSLAALSLGCFGALFFEHRRLGATHHGELHVHLRGMWVAFGVAALFIVYFVQRVTRALAAREVELAAARDRSKRAEKLASLATLAAGATHELSTPLSTIAVAAKELEACATSAEVASDAKLIREQVDRCRAILSQLGAEAGQDSGETFAWVSPRAIVDEAIRTLPAATPLRCDLPGEADASRLRIPLPAVAQALRALIKNAIDASPPGAAIRLTARASGDRWRLAVEDRGSGMNDTVLSRADEPFFTTKQPGAGMGLGLFLARTVLERIGGQLELSSDPGRGTTAAMDIPVDQRPDRDSPQSVDAEGIPHLREGDHV